MVLKCQFREKVDIASLCCQPPMSVFAVISSDSGWILFRSRLFVSLLRGLLSLQHYRQEAQLVLG